MLSETAISALKESVLQFLNSIHEIDFAPIAGVALLISLIARRTLQQKAEAGVAQEDPDETEGDLSPLYVLQPRWFSADRFYKVYLTPEALCGAWVAGQIHDEESGRVQLWPTGPLMWLTIRSVERRALEAMYDSLADEPTSIIERDSRNFVLRLTEIRSIRVIPTSFFWKWYREHGSLAIEMQDGTRWELIVRCGMDAASALRELAELGYPVEGIEFV